jgi:cyclopropane fatty-acyl-phospholipid synthase-like methyltransferase
VDERLRRLAHSRLTFNAPLSEERSAALVRDLALTPGRHALDLGCGWGELLLRVVAAHAGTTGTGVDTDRHALDRGRRLAAERRLHERVEFVEGDAASFEDTASLVLCVGASHAWGGTAGALGALRRHLLPGGRLLLADGFWERSPDDEAQAIFGDLLDFDGLVHAAEDAGYRAEDAQRSTQEEWDAFEAAWRAGLEASGEPEALSVAAERRHEYEEVYRGVLGFAWLVLA